MTAAESEMSPAIHFTSASSDSAISSFGRRKSGFRSKATAGTPASVNSASAQLPMQPPAPVTSTGPSKSPALILKCLSIVVCRSCSGRELRRHAGSDMGSERSSAHSVSDASYTLTLSCPSIPSTSATLVAAIPPPQ